VITRINAVVCRINCQSRAKMMAVHFERLALYLGATWGNSLEEGALLGKLIEECGGAHLACLCPLKHRTSHILDCFSRLFQRCRRMCQ
jgi:hypothetical protein